MFSCCSVCEYLRLLIDHTPCEQESMRGALQARQENDYKLRTTQGLAIGRLEELCADNGSAKVARAD